jgi:hypothetical protein
MTLAARTIALAEQRRSASAARISAACGPRIRNQTFRQKGV